MKIYAAANILAGLAGTTSGTVRQRRRPYTVSWAAWVQTLLEDCMEERHHHLNESSSARLRRSQKLEILPNPNSKSLGAYIFHKARKISTAALLLSYIMRREHFG